MPACGGVGAPLVIDFEAAGVTGRLTDVAVTLTALDELQIGSTRIELVAPDGSSDAIVDNYGAGATGCGHGGDLLGTYTFSDRAGTSFADGAAASWRCGSGCGFASVPNGTYRPQVEGLTASFAGIADPNGTWTLRLTTRANSSPAIEGASLSLSITTVPELWASTWPGLEVGQWASASASLTGDAPTGTVTFEIFGPGDEPCAEPLRSETFEITPETAGFIQTGWFHQVTEVGRYRWRVSYSGDDNNDAVATDCGGENLLVEVVPARVAAMELVRSAELVDVDGDGVSAGDEVRFWFTITNTGTTDVFRLAVEDPMLGGPVDCGPDDDRGTNLAGVVVLAGEALTCGPVAHVVTEDDLGTALTNTATATASTFLTEIPDDLAATASVSVAVPSPCSSSTTEPPATSEPVTTDEPASPEQPVGTQPPVSPDPPATSEPASTDPPGEETVTVDTSEPVDTTEPETTTEPVDTSEPEDTTVDSTPPSSTVFGFAAAGAANTQRLDGVAPSQAAPCGALQPAVSSLPGTTPPVTTEPPTEPPTPPAQPPATPTTAPAVPTAPPAPPVQTAISSSGGGSAVAPSRQPPRHPLTPDEHLRAHERNLTMSLHTASTLLDRIATDPALAADLRSVAHDLTALTDRLRRLGYEISDADLREAVLDRSGYKLSADQLEAVAGGELITLGIVALIAVLGGAIFGGGAAIAGATDPA